MALGCVTNAQVIFSDSVPIDVPHCLRKSSARFAIVSRSIQLVYDGLTMKQIGLQPL